MKKKSKSPLKKKQTKLPNKRIPLDKWTAATLEKIKRLQNNRKQHNKTLRELLGNYYNDAIEVRYVPINGMDGFFVIDLLRPEESMLVQYDVSIINDDSSFRMAILKSYKAGDFAVYYQDKLLSHGEDGESIVRLFTQYGEQIHLSLRVDIKNFFLSEEEIEGNEVKTKFYLRPDVDSSLNKVKELIRKAGLLYETIGRVKPKDPIKEHLKLFLCQKCAEYKKKGKKKQHINSLVVKDFASKMQRLFGQGAVWKKQFADAGLHENVFKKLIDAGWLKEEQGIGFVLKNIDDINEHTRLEKLFVKDFKKVKSILTSPAVFDYYNFDEQDVRRIIDDILKDSKVILYDPHGFQRYTQPAYLYKR